IPKGSRAAERGHSHLEQGDCANGDGGWLGWLGGGWAAPREHRLRLRPADIRLSKAQRSGPEDWSLRPRSVGGPGHADQSKIHTTTEDRRQGGNRSESLEQPASIWTRISCSSTLESINFSAINRYRLKAVDLGKRR